MACVVARCQEASSGVLQLNHAVTLTVAYIKFDRASSAARAIEVMHEAVLNDGRGPLLKVFLAEAPSSRCHCRYGSLQHRTLFIATECLDNCGSTSDTLCPVLTKPCNLQQTRGPCPHASRGRKPSGPRQCPCQVAPVSCSPQGCRCWCDRGKPSALTQGNAHLPGKHHSYTRVDADQ